MKKILKFSAAVVQTGLAAKGITDTVLHPLAAVRNMVKKVVIKSMVALIKQGISLATRGRSDASHHAVIRQLSALGSTGVDMTGLEKRFSLHMTLDSLLKEADENDVYTLFKVLDLSRIKNKFSAHENSWRLDAHEYITENDFANFHTLVGNVNEVLKMPTEVVGCEFAQCSAKVLSHDTVNRNFFLEVDVCFAFKSS